ncbi:hypothetical protein Clacol_000450 [Clathrus columnatus]|uniref:Tyrosine--tRNA ligase n=1 Tax=Clathrus columnatus TaxID=1419009 RepID=A0AAV4ZZ37_9AGAM|nr:hypothetical protein Clacol_000450 [Clathrus columnatus]
MLRCLSFLHKLNGNYKKTVVFRRNFTSNVEQLVSNLSSRGLIANTTTKADVLDHFLKISRTLYCGIDPTAGSLHVGNLVPLLNLIHFQLAGHQSIALLGGATGLIGDPSGRNEERPLQAQDIIQQHSTSIGRQLESVFGNIMAYASRKMYLDKPILPIKIMNNLDWWHSVSLVNFLQTTGKHMKIAPMLSRERFDAIKLQSVDAHLLTSVKSRMSSANGISFAEFSYQLLQAYDFWHLYKYHSCQIQVGGSDQWGNIVSGLDLILKREVEIPLEGKAYGITTPLLTTSSGQKFGKSAGNAIWLDSRKTSVFDFYQFFWRTTDADVRKYLNVFTLLSREDIENIIKDHKAHPERRFAQRILAREATDMIHGEIGLAQAEAATRLLFDTHLDDIRLEDAAKALENDPRYHSFSESDLINIPLSKLASLSGLVQSRGK